MLGADDLSINVIGLVVPTTYVFSVADGLGTYVIGLVVLAINVFSVFEV